MNDEPRQSGLSLVPDSEVIEGTIVRSRAEAAYALRQAGKSNADIAAQLGYSSPQEVSKSISKHMKQEAAALTTEEREGILTMELSRLDKLHEALWPSALYGDPKAVDAILKVMDRRMKWTGTDQPDSSAGQGAILVISGETGDYVQKLKELSEPPSQVTDDDEEED